MITKLAAIFFLLFAAATQAQDPYTEFVKQGDAMDAAMKTKEALQFYLEAEKLQPNNAELLHRIAKQYGETMNDVSSDTDKETYATKCLESAKRAVAADANNALAQVALAVAYGRRAKYEDNKTKISYSKLIKEHAEKALAIDPNCELAHHVLGAWNYELAGFGMVMRTLTKLIYGALPAASYTAAESYFKKALALNPKRVGNQVELGMTYLELDRKEDAKKAFEAALKMPNTYRDDEPCKARAREALK